jgi:ankyrin repeat protein
MNRILICALAAISALAASPAGAQGQFQTNGEQFVDAVRKDDGPKAMQLLRDHPTLINARDTKGDTALLVATRRGDREWTGTLLNSGADLDAAAKDGDTPLITASRIGFLDAVEWLTKLGAKINAANKLGETALIIAIQARNARVARVLLDAGADPDKTDYAGYSARDYAKRDTRSRQMSDLIEAKKPKK